MLLSQKNLRELHRNLPPSCRGSISRCTQIQANYVLLGRALLNTQKRNLQIQQKHWFNKYRNILNFKKRVIVLSQQ